MPSRTEARKVVAVAGIVGTDPEINEGVGSDGEDVLNFRLAVTTSYDEDAESKWFDVAVWNPGLIDSVEAEIYKGAKVAVEGTYSVRETDTNTYHKINAARVGLIEWLARSKSTGGSSRRSRDEEEKPRRSSGRSSGRSSSRSSGSAARAARLADAETRATSEDDLPW